MTGFWMNWKPGPPARNASSQRCRLRVSGLTLIEVVASLALMAGVLVAAISARATLINKAQRVADFQAAVEVLEQSVPAWEAAGWPATVSSADGFVFQVVDRFEPGLQDLGLAVRRYEARLRGEPGQAALAWIEVVVPLPVSPQVALGGGGD